MKLSELSERSDVPIASIKFYRREGLLPPGRAVGATTAEYDEDHLRRLKLIRALIRFGGLSVSAVRDVLAALAEPRNPAQVRGVVDYALPTDLPRTDSSSRADDDDGSVWAAEVIERMGWDISEMSPHRQALDERMRVLRRLDMNFEVDELLPYATLAESVAELDDTHLDSPGDSVTVAERVAVFSVLFGPVLPLLRRLAHENRARRTNSASPGFGDRTPKGQ